MSTSDPSPEHAGFTVHADGIDVEELVRTIQDEVAAKTAAGGWADAKIARAEKTNLVHIQDHDEFLDYYLSCVERATSVDINAFEIPDRKGGVVGKALLRFKQTIWSCLKFYTYRMWSQQNQINGLLTSSVRLVREHNDRQVADLEKRIDQLESALKASGVELPTDTNDPTP